MLPYMGLENQVTALFWKDKVLEICFLLVPLQHTEWKMCFAYWSWIVSSYTSVFDWFPEIRRKGWGFTHCCLWQGPEEVRFIMHIRGVSALIFANSQACVCNYIHILICLRSQFSESLKASGGISYWMRSGLTSKAAKKIRFFLELWCFSQIHEA
jgi:hypothetical protein